MKNIIHIKTITEAHNLMGFPKPKHPLVSVFYHCGPMLELDLEGKRISSELYMISLKDGLTGSFQYGRNSYDFHEGVMTFLAPGQVIGEMEVEAAPDSNAWNILIHPDLLRKSSLGKEIEGYNFFSYDLHEALHLSDDEKQEMTALVKKIEKEYQQNIDKHSQDLIISHLELMLRYAQRYYDRQFYTRSNMNKDMVSQFETLLKEYYQSGRPLELGIPSVKYCGAELNMSHKYLSDLLKKETGRTAQEHIQDFVIDKAKTQLLGTTLGISEIAYDLGFEYPQHLAKMFKRKTGMSATEYRRLN